MTPKYEQFQNAARDNMDAMAALARAQLGVLQDIASLNLRTLKDVYDTWGSNAKSIAGAKDLSELMEAQAALLQSGAQRAAEYWQTVLSLGAQAQSEAGRLAQRRLTESSAQLAALVEDISETLPAAGGFNMGTPRRGEADAGLADAPAPSAAKTGRKAA
jgi:phasin family protein